MISLTGPLPQTPLIDFALGTLARGRLVAVPPIDQLRYPRGLAELVPASRYAAS